MKNTFTTLRRALALAAVLAAGSPAARAQNVGVGTTAPTQKLDVNGSLRVRGLSSPNTRLPMVLPDGTLGTNAPVYGTTATSQPTVPTAAAGSVATSGAYNVAVSGTTAYVVNQGRNTFQAFNVANPAAPAPLGQVATDISPFAVAVSGTTAYVVNFYSNTLQAFNVANPAAPALLGQVATDIYPASVAVSGTTAYVVNQGSNTLQAFNVANPAAPALLGQVATGNNPNSVVVSGTTAYVVMNQGSNTLQAFNVANPAAPALLGQVTTGIFPISVAVSGTTAYVVNSNSNTLQAFNVANPAAPALLGQVATGTYPFSVAVSGTTAYVVNLSNGTLQTFSFSGPPRAVAVNADGSFASVALPSGADFVQNGTAPQAGSNFNVSGAGTVGGLLTAGSAKITTLTTAGLVQTDAAGNLSSASTASFGTSFIQNQNAADQAGNFRISGNGLVAGRVGIGTAAPSVALDVASAAGVQLNLTSTSTDPNGVISMTVPATSNACAVCSEFIIFNKAGFGGIGAIVANLSTNSVTYNTTSDKRLKEHITRTRLGLSDLMKIEVKDYNFIGTSAANRTTGFLAQDLFQIFPDAVKEGDHGTAVTNKWAVDYGRLTPLLVQAIQDQQKEIESLKARLAAQAGDHAALQTVKAQADADHASLLTLQQQQARLLGEAAPATAQARQ